MTPIIEDSTAGGGEIVIGLNGSKETYALKGEEYLEADAHAAEPADGLLNAKIKISGKVDTSKPGTYKVSYRVSDSSGHTAKAVRTVHVVESMETMQGGAPILMYHYVYRPRNPPATSTATSSQPLHRLRVPLLWDAQARRQRGARRHHQRHEPR